MPTSHPSPLEDQAARSAPPPEPLLAPERKFPLIALLQLATFWAAIVACVDGPRLGVVMDKVPVEPWVSAGLIAAAVLVGGALGFAVGLGQLRMGRSAVVGAGVGALYGIAILAVYVAPAPLAQCMAAAGVLIATTLILRIRAA